MTNKRFWLIIPLLLGAVFLLVSCGGEENDSPLAIYQDYYQACDDGRYETAETYLTEQARTKVPVLGVCGFTHDSINTYEIQQGNPIRTFSTEPEVQESENKAVISWYDDQGNIATVVLVKIDSSWQITDVIWST